MRKDNKLFNFIFQMIILLLLIGVVYIFYKKQINIQSYISELTVKDLPIYAFKSFIRMSCAYLLSLIFSIVYGILAATSKRREALMLPILDILQSVPILGFFPAAVFFFISLFPGSLIGVELSAIFLIFTSQSWNMAFGVYESVTSIPKDVYESYSFFDPEGRLKYSKLYIPSTIPKLVYNSIVSWANGWYFLVASEIFAIGPQAFRLKGIGSFILEAATQNNITLTLLGIITLSIVIILMDLFIWKPVSQWSKRFTYSIAPGEEEKTPVWEVVIIFWEFIGSLLRRLKYLIVKIKIPKVRFKIKINRNFMNKISKIIKYVILCLLAFTFAYLIFALAKGIPTIVKGISTQSILLVLKSIFFSFIRLLVAYLISLFWTFPFAIYMFTHPRFSNILSPITQVISSIPAISIFPILLYFLLPFKNGLNFASIILLLTGMQWYLLFNIYGGLKSIPSDLLEFSDSFGVRGLLKFKRLLLPATLPSLITGTITAWGGGWNALIVSEYINLKGKAYALTGIGSLLNVSLESNNKPLFIISLFIMVLTVYSINHFIYRRLYDRIVDKYRVEA